MEHDALLSEYLRHAHDMMGSEDADVSFSPATVQLDDLVTDQPEVAWTLIQELVRRATQDEVLAFIAAGPLEELICRHPYMFIDRVESLARSDPHFRWALSGVWGWSRMPEDVWARLEDMFRGEQRL
jgi:hypothetical protein